MRKLSVIGFMLVFCVSTIAQVFMPPNDPLFSHQWALNNTGQVIANQNGIPGVDIGYLKAQEILRQHELKTGSDCGEVVVAVLGTGWDFTHPDLQGVTVLNSDGVPIGPGELPVFTTLGEFLTHDTASTKLGPSGLSPTTSVGSVIAAISGNGIGIAGISHKARILPLQVEDAEKRISATPARILAATQFAIEFKPRPRIVVFPYAFTGVDADLKQAIDLLEEADVNVVLSFYTARDIDAKPSWPAGYNTPSMITVMGVDNTGARYISSWWGAKTVHLAAPGWMIPIATPDGFYGQGTAAAYAAAVVAGALAGVYAIHPELTATQVKELMIASSQLLSGLQGKLVGGLVRADKALTMASQ